MISSKDIEDYSYLVSARFEAINTHYLKLIAKQINEIGRLGPANLYRLQQMAKFNQNIAEINQLLAQETNRTLEELYQVYDMSGFSLYNDYADMYKAKRNGEEFRPEITKEFKEEFFKLVDKVILSLMEDKDNFYGYSLSKFDKNFCR